MVFVYGKFEMSSKWFCQGAIEYISLEFRREVEDGDKSRQCQHNDIKLRVEEIA